ncbi:MAG TPA: hypothetical protein VGP62_05410 [Bryobacteraceae bacterium]|jgi:hypothetical protein|nr:hypothetical protein [Bryobacteraceae bacterium]
MELVEGDTLKGPLPVETAPSYASQIADALEAAHEKGKILFSEPRFRITLPLLPRIIAFNIREPCGCRSFS